MFIVGLNISCDSQGGEGTFGSLLLSSRCGEETGGCGVSCETQLCVWLIVSHFLTCCEEVLHPPLYTPWGPLSCEINLWRQLGQHGQQGALPGPGERNQWHREEQWRLLFPSVLRRWCQDSAPCPQLGLTWTLLWGLSPIQQLEPCLSTAKRSLELLIYLLVNQFLRVRSKLAGQCPHTSCST